MFGYFAKRSVFVLPPSGSIDWFVICSIAAPVPPYLPSLDGEPYYHHYIVITLYSIISLGWRQNITQWMQCPLRSACRSKFVHRSSHDRTRSLMTLPIINETLCDLCMQRDCRMDQAVESWNQLSALCNKHSMIKSLRPQLNPFGPSTAAHTLPHYNYNCTNAPMHVHSEQ